MCPAGSESELCALWVAKDPNFLHADSEVSDQTGQMPRLIRVLAGCWFCPAMAHIIRKYEYGSFFFLLYPETKHNL